MSWQVEWPQVTQKEKWWFYGWMSAFSKRREAAPELLLIDVRPIANGCMYSTRGTILFKKEGVEGLWMKADLPELPVELFKKKFPITRKNHEDT